MSETAQALDIANKILQLTADVKLTGQPDLAEAEISAYAALMDEREPLVTQLMALLENEGNKDAVIKKTIKEIIDLDKRHREIVTHIKNLLQASIKDIKNGQTLSNKYGHTADIGYTGLLDAKQ